MNAEVIEVNGTGDHLHVLLHIPSTASIAGLVKRMKGASSHLATHKVPGGEAFKWQGSYSAFTVSEYEVAKVRNYIRSQKQHHRAGTVITRYEPNPPRSQSPSESP